MNLGPTVCAVFRGASRTAEMLRANAGGLIDELVGLVTGHTRQAAAAGALFGPTPDRAYVSTRPGA